jgi:uncharacterized protein (TIGR02246 family)
MSASAVRPQTAEEQIAAVAKVPQRFVEAWAANDAGAFAAVCTEDATLILPGGVCLKSREEIRSFMADQYAGPYKGTRVTGTPLNLRFLSDTVSVVITQGGVLMPGEEEVSKKEAIHATWVLTRHGAEWLVSAYHNCNINPS